MKERPILFSGPLVRALLSGTKTQTRRVIKPQPYFDSDGLLWWNWSKNEGAACNDPVGSVSDLWFAHCPYGAPGDRLWVRETFMDRGAECPTHQLGYPPGSPCWCGTALYRADDEAGHIDRGWLPSIFMPRALSRIALAVEAVRVERLHDITESDARAEGVDAVEVKVGSVNGKPASGFVFDLRMKFAALWSEINGAESWKASPWVWVVSFRRVTP